MCSATHQLHQQLLSLISKEDLAWFLYEEVAACLEHMNLYKSRNLWRHRQALCDHLSQINHDYSQLITDLVADQPCTSWQWSTEQLSYLADTTTLEQLWHQSMLLVCPDRPDIDTQVRHAINTYKAMLLFTLTEFIHGSSVRMDITTTQQQQKKHQYTH